MRAKSLWLALVLAALPLAGGCQRLNFEKDEDLKVVQAKRFTFDAPRYDQKVMVTVTPSDGPVCAYLIKTEDYEKLELALNRYPTPVPQSLVLEKKEPKEKDSYSFEATVPARTEYALVLYAPKKGTKVSVKLVGR
jgi:hypothetical protein